MSLRRWNLPQMTASGRQMEESDRKPAAGRPTQNRAPTPAQVLLGCAAAILLTACAAHWLKEPLRPAQTFSHSAHREVLGPRGFACVVCHPFSVDVLERAPEQAAEISRALLTPGKDACHHCHTDPSSPVSTVRRCTLCHEDLTPLRPADHDALWASIHGARARVDGTACNDCHRASDCVRCHIDRSTLRHAAHDPTYLSFHAIEARLEPGRCQRCHTASSCVGCHLHGEPTW